MPALIFPDGFDKCAIEGLFIFFKLFIAFNQNEAFIGIDIIFSAPSR
jgi:hypothetical protein